MHCGVLVSVAHLAAGLLAYPNPGNCQANEMVGLLQMHKHGGQLGGKLVQNPDEGCCVIINASNFSKPTLAGTERNSAEDCYSWANEEQDPIGFSRRWTHECPEDLIANILDARNWPPGEVDDAQVEATVPAALAQSIQRAAKSKVGVAPYAIFEDFESGTWPFSHLTYQSSSNRGEVKTGDGAAGTSRYLNGYTGSNYLDGVIWPSPVTSKTGSTLQAWIRYQEPEGTAGYNWGRLTLGFDTTSSGTKALYLDIPRFGSQHLLFRYVNLENWGPGVSSFTSYPSGSLRGQWLRILITIRSDHEVMLRLYDQAGNRKKTFYLDWVAQFGVNGTFSQNGTALLEMYYNINVDQLATCGSLPIQVSTDPGLCTASPSLQGCIPNADYSCNPVAGTALAAGSHEVICSGDDGQGNETHYFQVEVVDNEPPSFVAPPNIQESTCQYFARVHFNVEAVDNCAVVTSCTPPSGSVFAFGNTTVQCTATDPSGNMATSSFQVSVGRETEPPVFTAHPDIVTNTCSSFAQVTFQVEAKDNCGDVIPTCGPTSGSLFPVGSTEVHCTAVDLSGNSANLSFFVNVTGDSTPPTLHPLVDVAMDGGCKDCAQAGLFSPTGAVEVMRRTYLDEL